MIREDVVGAYLSLFQGMKVIKETTDPNFRLTDESISSIIDNLKKTLGEKLQLTDEEREQIIRKIKTINTVYQEEGSAILGNYDHDYQWYENLLSDQNFDQYYWVRYKNHLLNDKHMPPAIVERLEDTTLRKIMSYIGNPKEKDTAFSIRGLVVGDVQSGKTSNYIGLTTKAADAGYKVIFILTGTIESLRKQTQQRLEEGFIGYNVVTGEDVGVKRGEKTPMSFTSRAKDYTGTDNLNTTYRLSDSQEKPFVYIIKKNKSVLQKVFSSLKTINTTNEHQKIDCPILLIDDEADNASVNTNKLDGEHDPTIINALIRNILSLFTRNTYVGFTATPFANVFINYDEDEDMINDDLFPKDFIYALNPPSNYCGARRYFFERNNNVKFIKDDYQTIFPIDHKKDWVGDRLYESVYYSINCFLLSNAIRDIRDANKNTHRSMLINISRFTDVQIVIKDIVENYVKDVVRNVRQSFRTLRPESNIYVKALKECFDKEYKNCYFAGKPLKWKNVLDVLYDSTKNIQTVVVNSSKHSAKLNYDEHKEGLKVIAIGGLALSRGLTLEGLCVSYFYRNTSTYDVLMQMGRWFGYRDGYDDLVKIFITKESHDYYKEICLAIETLKKDIDTMGKQDKRPTDYGIRVRNSDELSITARNKMQNTKLKVDRKSFYGCLYETPYLYADLTIMNNNINSTFNFINSIDFTKRDHNVSYPYFRDVDVDLVKNLLTNIKVNDLNINFDTAQIIKFLNNHKDIEKFDVLLMGGDGPEVPFENEYGEPYPYNIVSRNFDLKDRGKIVRMSGVRAHIWGPSDTALGLTKEERKEVIDSANSNPSAAMYLNKHKNPLLIIYFINLKGVSSSENDTTSEIGKYRYIVSQNKYKFLVGHAIGFPMKPGELSSATMYVVNTKVNYYDKLHSEDDSINGEE